MRGSEIQLGLFDYLVFPVTCIDFALQNAGQFSYEAFKNLQQIDFKHLDAKSKAGYILAGIAIVILGFVSYACFAALRVSLYIASVSCSAFLTFLASPFVALASCAGFTNKKKEKEKLLQQVESIVVKNHETIHQSSQHGIKGECIVEPLKINQTLKALFDLQPIQRAWSAVQPEFPVETSEGYSLSVTENQDRQRCLIIAYRYEKKSFYIGDSRVRRAYRRETFWRVYDDSKVIELVPNESYKVTSTETFTIEVNAQNAAGIASLVELNAFNIKQKLKPDEIQALLVIEKTKEIFKSTMAGLMQNTFPVVLQQLVLQYADVVPLGKGNAASERPSADFVASENISTVPESKSDAVAPKDVGVSASSLSVSYRQS